MDSITNTMDRIWANSRRWWGAEEPYVLYSPWGHKELDMIKWLNKTYRYMWGFPVGSGKESTCQAGDAGSIPGFWRPPRVGNDNSFWYSCLDIPWTEEPGGLQSMGLQRVEHNLVTEQWQYTHTTFKIMLISTIIYDTQ